MTGPGKKCLTCGEVLPLRAFKGDRKRDCKDCRDAHKETRARGVPGCQVWMVAGDEPCMMAAEVDFAAVCECGHRIEGRSCRACLQAAVLGCLTCWQGEREHRCPVRFLESVEAVS